MTFEDKYFHINTPYFGAWTEYGWGKDDWGLGLNKKRIDRLAKAGETVYVSYINKRQLYTIKAKKVQEYPVEEVRWSKTKLYIIQKSALNYSQSKKSEIKLEELAKGGVFG